jgi:hypothetical protein
VSVPTNLQANAVSGAIAMIFPSLPTGVAVGASWTDTTSSEVVPAIKSKSTEINQWTFVAQDTLRSRVTTTTVSDVGADMGTMTANASGTRQVIFDRSRSVSSATLTLTNSGVMGEIKITGNTRATLTRLP